MPLPSFTVILCRASYFPPFPVVMLSKANQLFVASYFAYRRRTKKTSELRYFNFLCHSTVTGIPTIIVTKTINYGNYNSDGKFVLVRSLFTFFPSLLGEKEKELNGSLMGARAQR